MTCSNCGATGIHACIGFKPEPWTDEEKERLRTAIDNCLANPAELRKEITELKRQLEEYAAEESDMRAAGFENAQDLFTSYVGIKQKLAESQAREARLRDVLNEAEHALDECRDYPITYDSVLEALALPHDDTALKEYLKQAIEKEKQDA